MFLQRINWLLISLNTERQGPCCENLLLDYFSRLAYCKKQNMGLFRLMSMIDCQGGMEG